MPIQRKRNDIEARYRVGHNIRWLNKHSIVEYHQYRSNLAHLHRDSRPQQYIVYYSSFILHCSREIDGESAWK